MLPAGAIIPFDGKNSEISAGFVRDTRFDDRFPLGSNSSFGETGGSATHSHGSLSHTHNIGAHTHSGRTQLAYCGSDTDSQSGSDIIRQNHYHNYSGDGHSAGTSQGCSINTSASNIPEYYAVIFIRAQKPKRIPDKGLVWSALVDNKRALHQASKGKFLMGASSGADAGGAGGSNSHSHTLDHTHMANNHTHSITTGKSAQGADRACSWSSTNQCTNASHTHTQTLSGSAQSMNTAAGSVSATLLPYHSQINLYEAAGRIKKGDIVMTTDSVTPRGWLACDGTKGTPKLDDRFIRNTSSATNTVVTAGANTHNHGTWSHAHIGSGTHTHGDGGTSNHTAVGAVKGNAQICSIATLQHVQGGFTCSSTTADYESTTVAIPEIDNKPPYIRVRFIMATPAACANSAHTLLWLMS